MKQSSNTFITIISFVLLQFLAPFATNRAEAETIKRVIATYDFDPGTSNIYTWTKVGDTDYKLANWPGSAMTKFSETNNKQYYYDFTSTDGIEKAQTGIIFNNGSKQTNDIKPGLTGDHVSYVYKVKNDGEKWSGDLRVTTDVLIGPGTGEGYALYTADKVNGKNGVWASSKYLPQEHIFTKGTDGNYHLTIDGSNSNETVCFRVTNTQTLDEYGAEGEANETIQPDTQKRVYGLFTDKHCWQINCESGKSYGVTVHFENELSNCWVYVEELGSQSNYYFVSPEVTGGRMLPQYKLIPDRHRQGGPVSKTYYTLNFKADELCYFQGEHKGQLIGTSTYHWYIKNAETGDCYVPTSDGDGFSTWSNSKNSNVWISSTTATIDNSLSKMFSRTNYTNGRSYTIFFNSRTLDVSFNVNNDGCTPDDDGGFYLIGNFGSAKANVVIDPSTEDGKKVMTKSWWKDGTKYSSSVASCDSIVYTVSVNRPDAGWGQLYLDVCPVTGTTWADFASADNTTKINAWKRVIRPQIQDIECSYSMDARALSGGLIRNETGNSSWLQSLNPDVSDVYTSYEFSMNVTYSTYRIVFKTELSLVGTAVRAIDDEKHPHGGNFSLDATDSKINLELDEQEGCYKWPYNNGKIHIKSYEGKGMPEFRFVVTSSTTTGYQWNFSEDGNAPTSPYYNDAFYGDQPYINTANGTETQFRNFLAMHKDGSTSTTDPGSGNIHSYLPEGDYVLRFYIKGDEEKTYYYTLEHPLKMRDYRDVEYEGNARTVVGIGNYTYLTTWSDYLAYEKPAGVDIYAVTGFSSGGAATLVDITDQVDCLPANTGLILAKKDVTGGTVTDRGADPEMPDFKVLTIPLKVYEEPEKTYPEIANQLTPSPLAQELQQYSDGKANYLFGAYREDLATGDGTTSASNFLLGFWLSNGTRRTYHNSAYISLDGQQQNQIFPGAAYTGWTGSSSPSRSWISVSFGGINTSTRILSPKASTDDGLWYNLQGMGTSHPMQKGLYIHQGRKVIRR